MKNTINKFNLLKKYHTKWNIREEDYKNIILTDDLEIHIIELPKYLKMSKSSKSFDVWLNFLLNPNEKGGFINMDEKNLVDEARTKWKEIISDEQIRDRALRLEIARLDYNTGLKHAKEEGWKEGHSAGIEQGIEQIILEMHKQHLSDVEISKLTKVDVKKIKTIIDKI